MIYNQWVTWSAFAILAMFLLASKVLLENLWHNSQLRNLFSFFSHKRTAFSIRIYRNSCCPTKKRILFGLFDSFKGDRELYNYLSREMIGRDRGRNRWRRGPRNGRRASVGVELDRWVFFYNNHFLLFLLLQTPLIFFWFLSGCIRSLSCLVN